MKRSVASILFAGAMATAASAEDLKIGLIYPSPVADVGWAKQLDLGREAIVTAFGDRVSTTVVESVPEGPDAARVMNQMVSDGAGMIMLGSFGYMNDGLKLAASNPDLALIHASGFKQTENFATFTARNYEGFYLAGLAAGEATEKNTVGIVAAFAIPEVIAEVNAISLAVHEVNQDAKIMIVWVNTWFDPPKEQEAARALISQGADVLFSLHQDTPSVVNVAQAEGVKVVNTGSDMSKYGPDAVLASVTNDWSALFVAQVEAKLNGTFVGADHRGGLKDGTVKVIWGAGLREEQKAPILAKEAALISGEAHAFAGPISDQSGAERVAAGANLADGEIFSMDWLVAGIDGSLPN